MHLLYFFFFFFILIADSYRHADLSLVTTRRRVVWIRRTCIDNALFLSPSKLCLISIWKTQQSSKRIQSRCMQRSIRRPPRFGEVDDQSYDRRRLSYLVPGGRYIVLWLLGCLGYTSESHLLIGSRCHVYGGVSRWIYDPWMSASIQALMVLASESFLRLASKCAYISVGSFSYFLKFNNHLLG